MLASARRPPNLRSQRRGFGVTTDGSGCVSGGSGSLLAVRAAPVLQIVEVAKELDVAVGTQMGGSESLPVEPDWEGKSCGRDAHFAVIAGIGRAWHDYRFH